MTRRFIFVLLLSLLGAACGASTAITSDTDVTSESATADNSAASVDTSAVDDPDDGAQPDSEQPAAAEPTATPVPEPTATPVPEPEPIIAGVDLIPARSVPAVSGNPTLSWDEAPDAATYRVTVLDETGTPYWAWAGPEIEVTPPDGGPVIADGYQWTVVAFTTDDVLLAASARQTVGG